MKAIRYFFIIAMLGMALINFTSCEKDNEISPENPIETKDTFSVSFTLKLTLETPYDAANYVVDYERSGLSGSLAACSTNGNEYFIVRIDKNDFADGVTYEKNIVVTGDSARAMIGMGLLIGAELSVWPKVKTGGPYVKQYTTPETPTWTKVKKNNSFEIKVYFEEE